MGFEQNLANNFYTFALASCSFLAVATVGAPTNLGSCQFELSVSFERD